MEVPSRIVQLIEHFDRNYSHFKSNNYNETQLRREFLDPFFIALGWDVNNESGTYDAYKDVIHEDAIKIGGFTKAPDYCFRVGGNRKFFVEAKKPAVNIKDDATPAYQLRRYAWSAKLPLSILSDFEELAIYDCRIKPNLTDKASIARTIFFNYKDYLTQWDKIASIFSKDAVWKGELDKYADVNKLKKGTTEVDDAFLDEIENWRDILARNLALRNESLTQRQLNEIVQKTIDRIVFLRICEDRNIEKYGRLINLVNGANIYSRLCQMFEEADAKYNSGLFHFRNDGDQVSPPDELSLHLNIDDKVLKEILKKLYYPDSPYEFSVLPADILGHVYEQFLGKVIRLTAGHQAKVEEKPEVKKAGGVYYTPTYIVDYIVNNTVGKLLEGKTPKEVSELKILDPACGSGSFLIVAYQKLLDWHLKWYLDNIVAKLKSGSSPSSKAIQDLIPIPLETIQSKKRKSSEHYLPIIELGPSDWRLTMAERKRILLNNIFGVDIDSQAVEVTKLSLLLKVLENENEQTLTPQLKLFQDRALPDLANNIKCGNSLLESKHVQNQILLLSDDEVYRINAFDWQREFAEIMARGGFDAVIGNPPYIRIQTMKEWAPIEVELYKQFYKSASSGNYDIYLVFVEQALKLLNKAGLHGYILPHKFFNAQYGEQLRTMISRGKHLAKIVHFGDKQIFEGATTYTCLLFLSKAAQNDFSFEKVQNIEDFCFQRAANPHSTKGVRIESTKATSKEWNFIIGSSVALFEKLGNMSVMLADVAELFVGLQTDADDVYILEQIKIDSDKLLCFSKFTGKEHWFENSHLKDFLKGSLNIRRYHFSDVTKRLIFPYQIVNGKSILIDQNKYRQNFPLTWSYLEECKLRLSARNKGNMGKDWYGYVYKKNHTKFDRKKILVPSIAMSSCFSLDSDGKFYFVGSGGGGGGGYGISILPDKGFDYLYILGILNSKLLSEYIKKVSTPFRHGYFALNRQYINNLPIRDIKFTISSEKAAHDKMVGLVETMINHHKRLDGIRSNHEKEMIQRQIDATDRMIDQLVYELYGLTEEEIKIIEEKSE